MKKAYIFAAIAILSWSTLSTVSKLLLESLNSFQMLMISSVFAALALLIINIATGKIKLLWRLRPKDYLIIILICLPGNFLYYVFLYLGTAKMAASQAFIINYLWPIMSIIFACIILHERLTARKCIAIALSFLGVITVAGKDIFNFNPDILAGAGLCILAAVSYGAFTALCRKWNYDEQLSMMLSFFSVFILSAIINAFMGTELKLGLPEVLGLGWNGVAVMAVATVAWALALKHGGTAKISNLAYITPFLSLFWTFIVLKEPIEPLSVVGLVIIIVGIFIQLKDKGGVGASKNRKNKPNI